MQFFIFLIIFGCSTRIAGCSPALEQDTSLHSQPRILGEGNNSETMFWDKSAFRITAPDEHEYDCNMLGHNTYKYGVECKQYYRCGHDLQVMFYECFDKFLFDIKQSKCLPEQEVVCDSRDICRNKPDNLYPDYKENCQQYYRCENGTMKEASSCPDGECFDSLSRRCLPENQAIRVDVKCPEDSSIFSILPRTRCRGYYKCQHGTRADYVCPEGEMFDMELETCRKSATCYEPICTGRINGVYPDTTSDCRRGFQCDGGQLTSLIHCPHGQKYKYQTCAPSNLVHCEEPQKTAVLITTGRHVETCSGKEDGVLKLPGSGCRKYIECRSGITTYHECPDDTFFDGVECRNDKVCDDLCYKKSNGYYADEDTGCRQYYYCQDGNVSDRKTCPEGSLFSGTMCLPGQLVTCETKTLTSLNTCEGLGTGYHPDYLAGCKQYVYCSEGNIIIRKSCPGNLVWNGTECVDGALFMCKGPEPWDGCKGFKPGLYQDLSITSLCKLYHFCYNGNRTVMSCQDGDVFDGETCVSNIVYKCPSLEEDSCINKPDGYYTSHGCETYYFCTNGYKSVYVCPEDHLFNGTRCVPSHTFTCPRQTSDCKNKKSGYYPDQHSLCSKYHFCHKGLKYITLTCSKKKIFNGARCVNANDVKTECDMAVNNICRHELDGVVVLPGSNCQKYVQCRSGTRIKEHVCSPGTLFNGTACAPDITCNQTVSDNVCAHGQKNAGYVQVLSNNCRSYYFCAGTTKLTITCPGETVFDGRNCVEPSNYVCPSIIDNCSQLNVDSSECSQQYQT